MRFWWIGLTLLTACAGARARPEAPRERVYVGVEGCRDVQEDYLRAHVADLDALDGPTWRMAIAPRTPSVVVVCADFADDCARRGLGVRCEPGAARYRARSGRVEVDPARTNGEFEFAAAALHELVHWAVERGPRPELAGLHVCASPDEGADCWTGGYGPALMNPGLGRQTWQTANEMFGDVPQYTCTDLDVRFYRAVTERR